MMAHQPTQMSELRRAMARSSAFGWVGGVGLGSLPSWGESRGGSNAGLGAGVNLKVDAKVAASAAMAAPQDKPLSPCARVAMSYDQATPEDIRACGLDIASSDSVETAGRKITYVGVEVAQKAAAVGATAACAATGVGVVISPFCGVAAGFLASKLAQPIAGLMIDQWHILNCIADCDCLTERSRTSAVLGRQTFDAYSALCSDASCKAWLYSTYVSNLPVAHMTFKVAGFKAKKCPYRTFPTQTMTVTSSGNTVNIKGGGPYLPDPALFARSAQRSATFVAKRAAEESTRWAGKCFDDTCRQDVYDAAVVLGAEEAKANLSAGVFLPGAPTTWKIPSTPDVAKAQIAKARAQFDALMNKAVSASRARVVGAAAASGQTALAKALDKRTASASSAGSIALERAISAKVQADKTKRTIQIAQFAIGLAAVGVFGYLAGTGKLVRRNGRSRGNGGRSSRRAWS